MICFYGPGKDVAIPKLRHVTSLSKLGHTAQASLKTIHMYFLLTLCMGLAKQSLFHIERDLEGLKLEIRCCAMQVTYFFCSQVFELTWPPQLLVAKTYNATMFLQVENQKIHRQFLQLWQGHRCSLKQKGKSLSLWNYTMWGKKRERKKKRTDFYR